MKRLGHWLVVGVVYAGIFLIANAKFMPTPEMLKARVSGWVSVAIEEDTNLNDVMVKYCKSYHKVDFVTLRDLIVSENPDVVRYDVRKGDVLKIPLIR